MIKLDGWITIGTKLSTAKFDQQIKELENKIDSEEKKQELLNNKTREYREELAKANNEVFKIAGEYDKAKAKVDELKRTLNSLGERDPKRYSLEVEYDKQKEQAKQLEKELQKARKQQTSLRDRVSQTKLQYENTGKAIDKLRAKIGLIKLKRHQAEFKAVEKSANSFKDIVSNTISKLGKMAFAVLGIRSAYNLLRRASSTLGQYNEQYAKNLEYIQFAIAQGLAPVLQWVVNLTQTLLGYVNALFQTLFGINLFANASAKNFEKMSKSASGVAKSSKEIKNNLASFDEINVLSQNNDTSGGGASGGIAPSFDLSKIENTKLLNLDVEVDANLSYTEKFKNIGKNIAEQLNKKIKEIDFRRMGLNLGKGINSVMSIAYGFVSSFDWDNLGQSLSDTVNGFFEEIDFATVAKTLSKGLAGIYKTIASFIENVNWEQVADKIYDFFTNIDWEDLVKQMARLLGSALGGFSRFVIEFLIINPAEDLAQYFYDKMEEAGGDAWAGFCKGIVDALRELGRFIVEDVWNPFINAFKNAFGIHSPSTKMAEMGEFIVQGLFNGISGLIHIITQPFEDIITKIQDTINGIITYIQNDFTTNWEKSWNKVKDFFGGIWDGIVGVVKGAINLIIDFINEMIAGIEKALNWIIDKINNFNIKDPFSGETIWSFNIPKVEFGRIPKLAQGGIVAKPTQAIIGEGYGKGAVLPLESNTEWMDMLAEGLADRIPSGSGDITIRFEGTMAQFVRELKPQIEIENRRAGARIITGGAY